MVTIRNELPKDLQAVFAVNARAFETDLEARLVDALRTQVTPIISLVAELDDRIVGHIMFTPVSVGGITSGGRTMGLAPMAVLPGVQNKGIGSELVRRGLYSCRDLETQLVFVLGHPNYYPRFGFRPAAPEGLHYIDAKLDAYFFVLELAPGSLEQASGVVEYHQLFSSIGA